MKTVWMGVMGAAVALGVASGAVERSHAAPTAPVTQASHEVATLGETVLATGTFEKRARYAISGGVSIQQIDGAWAIVLADDFSFAGAPDPKVALGADGFRQDTVLELLRSNSGQQVYVLPAHLDPTEFNQVWIWCERFSVPLGVAALNPA